MTDKQIKKISIQFTKGALSKLGTKDMCFAVCCPLQAYLSICGVESELVEGEIVFDSLRYHHFWIELSSGAIIDPTSDQFIKPDGSRMENIYVGEKPDYYQNIKKPIPFLEK